MSAGDPPTAADHRLAGLVRLARALAGARSLDDVAQRAAGEARFALGADAALLLTVEREVGLLRVLAAVGAVSPPARLPAVGAALRLVDVPSLAGVVDEARSLSVGPAVPGDGLAAAVGHAQLLAAPVFADGRTWGGLLALRAGTGPAFDAADLDFATALAGLVTAGLSQVAHLARMERLAFEDPLTGLANRRAVEARLDDMLAESDARPVAVLMADVNRLKAANDEYGHEAGDTALVAIAGALSVVVGQVPGAVAGRLGGDEFAAVLPGVVVSRAAELAAEFVQATAHAPYGVSVAVGVAGSEQLPGRVTRSRLLAAADAAQYTAKRTRAGGPVVADPAVVPPAERRTLRPRADGDDLVGVALDALTAAGRGGGATDRLAVVAAALRDELGLGGWVVSRLRAGAAVPARSATLPQLWAGASLPAPPGAGWLRTASGPGLVVDRLAGDPPLAEVRGCDWVVAVAAAGHLVELLGLGPTPVDGLPTVLRRAVRAAVGQ